MHKSLILVLLALPLAHAAGAASAPSAVAPVQDRTEEFKTKFQAAMKLNDRPEMARLVRQFQRDVSNYVVELCEIIPTGSNERIETEIAALKVAWEDSFNGSRFVSNVYEYFSLIDPQAFRERKMLMKRYTTQYKRYFEAFNAKDGPTLQLVAMDLEAVGGAFTEVGDLFYAAKCYGIAGIALDESIRGEGADLRRSTANYGLCLERLDRIQLQDTWYQEVKQRYDRLVILGYSDAEGGAGGGAGAGGGPAPAVEASAGLTVPMVFEPVAKLDAFQRPVYTLDEIHPLWQIAFLGEIGSSASFQAMPDGPKVLRVGSSKLALDTNGDGEGDMDVPSKGNKTLVQFKIGEGEDQRDWAVITEVGTQGDSYQGYQVNLQSDERQFGLYCAPAASLVGTIGGETVRVFDDNMDGRYGPGEMGWQHKGLLPGVSQMEIDSLAIGKSKRAGPWSEFVKVGERWYQLATAHAGLELQATPAEVETGLIQCTFKGPEPEYVILRGQGALNDTFVDLMANGGKPVEAPVGRYDLFFGIVRKGKKAQMMKALILPGKNTPSWTVEAEAPAEVVLGAPFGFSFETAIEEDMLRVQGKSVVITGVSDEHYDRLWNCVPKPVFSWRVAGEKRGSKPDKMDLVKSLDELADDGTRKYDYEDCYRPLDALVEVKLDDGQGVEVQLVEKKNKLFGKIESSWR